MVFNGFMSQAGGRNGDSSGISAQAGGQLARIVLADDCPEVLEEIRDLLASDFTIVGAANEGTALVRMANLAKPDVVITDIEMGEPDGILAGRRILEGGMCASVIVLTMHNEPPFLERALKAGIQGFILKIDAGEELIPAVREVMAGRIYVSRNVRRAI
jgi:DNA-binding NarL/FixJ family response regulator